MDVPSVKLLNTLQLVRRIVELVEGRELSPQETSRLHSEVLYLEKDLKELLDQITSLEKEFENLYHDLSMAERAKIEAEMAGEKARHRSTVYSWIMFFIVMLLLWIWRGGQ